ncbi:MAG: glutathione S-transferase N-terminal domain-containing protein [Beijerinckiaceae bacterium]|jgi:glutathione S-transferase|nr:glutathione S-transferase N-terminal domain-containing protein [Beijerinckiaceae bacterium]
MILIGQYDSPFTRRVGIALTHYGVVFEHRPWSIMGDANKIRPYNPLLRVPTLVRDDGSVLVETLAILDFVDSLAPPGKALISATEPERSAVLRLSGFASGISDAAVSLFYEMKLHAKASPMLVERRRGQIRDTLAMLELEAPAQDFWFGVSLTHADIAVAASIGHLAGAHPDLFSRIMTPRLVAHAERAEALPEFREIYQPFIAPD